MGFDLYKYKNNFQTKLDDAIAKYDKKFDEQNANLVSRQNLPRLALRLVVDYPLLFNLIK